MYTGEIHLFTKYQKENALNEPKRRFQSYYQLALPSRLHNVLFSASGLLR